MKRWKWVLPLVCGLHSMDACAGWLDGAGLELRHDDNLARAQLEQDRKSDTALVASAAAGTGYQLSDSSQLSLTLALSGSAYKRYHGLDHLDAGLELAYRWKFGLGPYVPELRLSGSATRLEYNNALRDGWLYVGEIGVAKRLSNRAGLRLAYQVERRRSDQVGARVRPEKPANVFDLNSHNLIFSGDYSLHPDYVLSAAYTLRDGDNVSTALGTARNRIASSAMVVDPVFGPQRRISYMMHARTRALSLGLTRIIGARASFTLGYDHLDSRVGGGIDYASNLVHATYLFQF